MSEMPSCAEQTLRVTIVGDRDPTFEPHRATDAALSHTAHHLGIAVGGRWLGTERVAAAPATELA